MKKVYWFVVVVLCFGLRASQVLDSDNDMAQLDALSKKFENEAKCKRESIEGKVVSPVEYDEWENSSKKPWGKDNYQEQERIKNGYEQK